MEHSHSQSRDVATLPIGTRIELWDGSPQCLNMAGKWTLLASACSAVQNRPRAWGPLAMEVKFIAFDVVLLVFRSMLMFQTCA